MFIIEGIRGGVRPGAEKFRGGEGARSKSQFWKGAGRRSGFFVSALSARGQQAAVVEVNSETDFVAKNPEFIEFVETLAVKALEQECGDIDSFMTVGFGENGTVGEALTEKISKTEFRTYLNL